MYVQFTSCVPGLEPWLMNLNRYLPGSLQFSNVYLLQSLNIYIVNVIVININEYLIRKPVKCFVINILYKYSSGKIFFFVTFRLYSFCMVYNYLTVQTHLQNKFLVLVNNCLLIVVIKI